MKLMIKSLILIFCLRSNALADGTYLSCTNGEAHLMGDAFVTVNLFEDGLEINQYESSFTIDATQAQMNNATDTIYVLDTTVSMSSEGIESESIVDAVIILSEDDKKMEFTISLDKGAFYSYEMTCTEQSSQ